MATILILIGVVAFYEFFKVPDLQKEIDSFDQQGVEMVFLPGKVDTVTEVDTLWREASPTEDPSLEEEADSSQAPDSTQLYSTPVEDSLITGTIYSRVGYGATLQSTWFDYRFKKPIFSTSRTDTLIIDNTIIKRVEVPAEKNFRVTLGASFTVGPDHFGLGPSIGFLTKQDHSYSYSWDPINGIHWVSYKVPIRLF